MKKLSLFEQIEELINDSIKPAIQFDGGDIELVQVDEVNGLVQVKLTGACVGCVLAPITLHLGVEKEIKKKFPQITKVEMID